jgi:hypothetical protein
MKGLRRFTEPAGRWNGSHAVKHRSRADVSVQQGLLPPDQAEHKAKHSERLALQQTRGSIVIQESGPYGVISKTTPMHLAPEPQLLVVP